MTPLRIGFVTGATPDKWARHWREQRREPLELVPVTEDEQLVRPHSSGWRPEADQLEWPEMTEQEAIETVAAGTGVVIMPMSIARLHQRKDVVTRVVSDLEPTTIALVWRIERDDEVTQTFVGVTKGRTARSSR